MLAAPFDKGLPGGRRWHPDPDKNSNPPSSSAIIYAACQLQVAAQNVLAAFVATHYEGRGAVRAALGCGNLKPTGLVPAVAAPIP